MSFIKLGDDRFERFTLVTHVSRSFTSGSTAGITGTLNLFARRPTGIKEIEPIGSFLTSSFNEGGDPDVTRLAIVDKVVAGTTNVLTEMGTYLTEVNAKEGSRRLTQATQITRNTPGQEIERIQQMKAAITNNLMTAYRPRYPTSQFAYGNYHCLNFFTASSVVSNSVIIYPNSGTTVSGGTNRIYTPSGSFTLSFYINPRYTTDEAGTAFNAGTIFHISSSIALSLASGSLKDNEGRPDAFRLILQLSHSADVAPSDVNLATANNTRTYPDNLIFTTPDNSLKRNFWHHVAVTWGTNNTNDGTGSFFIDGSEVATFDVPSSSIKQTDAGCVFIGNFLNLAASSNDDQFFNSIVATDEGTIQLNAGTLDLNGIGFTHPLNAEIHDIRLYNSVQTGDEILTASLKGPETLSKLLFYVPVFFVKETKARRVLRTPFISVPRKSTESPFNTDFSFHVDGHIVNVENFTREFVQGYTPRLYQLTESIDASFTNASSLTATQYMYEKANIRKRNLTVLPCDNGKFYPNFTLLNSGSTSTAASGSATSVFVTDMGGYDPSLISLRELIETGSIQGVSSTFSGLSSNDPDNFTATTLGTVPAVLQKTKDPDSRAVVIFNISNNYFGTRIDPGTFRLYDSNMSGSNGKIPITLKDNSQGALYRADAKTKHATWNHVGNIFYSEGVVLIKSPNLPLFGKDQFEISFKGERPIYVLTMNLPAPSNMINSSSNPVYQEVSASLNANDTDSRFVYITGINVHDENLNVVMKTKLAQPVLKRSGEKLLFKVKQDW